MKAVLIRFKDSERRDYPLKGNRAVIGRRPDCDLRIPTSDVSRQHCEVLTDEKHVLVRDLGSANGTYVNGKRVAEKKLAPGDRLRIGPVVFVVQIDGKPAKIEPAAAKGSPAARAAAPVGDELDELVLDLNDTDFELDEPLTEMEPLADEGEEDKPKKAKGK